MSRPSAWWRWRAPVVGVAIAAALAAVTPHATAAQAVGTDTVRIRLALSIPATAMTRRSVPGEVEHLADGRHVISFGVTVTANCEWTLGVRRRSLWRTRLSVPMEVQDAAGQWVPLGAAEEPVRVIPSHEPCRDDTHVVRLRVADSSAVALLERVEFVVAPLAKP